MSDVILVAIAVGFAAVCIWLGVRIFNRRERWAKRTLAGFIAFPVLYLASFGPACWLTNRRADHWKCPRAMVVYWPLGHAFTVMGLRRQRTGNRFIQAGHEVLTWWITVGLPKDGSAIFPTSS